MSRKRKAEQSPSFFKVLVGHQYEEKVKIPHDFVQYFNGQLPRELVIRVYNRRFWQVEVKQRDGAFFFENGWKAFITDNLLELGDFLVFKFSSNSVLDVLIFDKTACEKELPTKVKTEPPEPESHHKRDRVSVGHCNVCNCRYRAKFSVKIAGAGKSSIGLEFDGTSCAFKIKKPHFFAKYKQGYVVFPVTFWRETGLLHKELSLVYLHDPKGRSWEVDLHRWNDYRCHLGAKWKVFVAENNLRVEDRCAFELMNAGDHGCKTEFMVHIFRQGEMSCPCSSCA
ncbi:hypothetical protein H6P81_020946 [Aristolochia fimbriata]|uniref:TF-B3 domain-containing protein n=1 Tax=Aristolochia fimbriata TaxID=158543 RepID=A0AAV7DX18_ARIFI|nr:hypothetical protein H6P81_020946 [Aristolochia fimbriata]